MTVVRDPGRQCDGKVRWTTKAKAKESISRLKDRGGMAAYRCPHCEFFHIGHKGVQVKAIQRGDLNPGSTS